MIRWVLSIIAILATGSAAAQSIDYSIQINMNGVYVAGNLATYTLVVKADHNDDQPFVARVAVPPELEFISVCSNGTTYDEARRAITWTGHVDNVYTMETPCPLVFRMSPTLTPQSTFLIMASVESTRTDPNTANNIAIVKGYVVPAADVALSVTPELAHLGAGEAENYTITVVNSGPNEARDVSLVDAFSDALDFLSFTQTSGPAATISPVAFGDSSTCYQPRCGSYIEMHIATMESGSSARFTLATRGKSSIESAYVVNHASVRTSSFDPELGNNDKDTYTAMGPNADLTIGSSTLPDADGIHIPISITVSNNGPSIVNDVLLDSQMKETNGSDYGFVTKVKFMSATASQGSCAAPSVIALPASPQPPAFWDVQCSVGSLAPGARATVTILVERATKAGPADVTSTVSPAQNDPVQSNNTSVLRITQPSQRRRSVRN